eukprot:comp27008_c0_seq1/m.47134 comp27008_c0_seq1/g.47134  ORF comp27008_c0_seq1/g.47134 comp27008_c0_seq1/m.47134 type:complete len:596 (-) comp27008_c0_seq1:425-2212(-)
MLSKLNFGSKGPHDGMLTHSPSELSSTIYLKHETRRERAKRFCSENKKLVIVLIVLFLAILLGIIVGLAVAVSNHSDSPNGNSVNVTPLPEAVAASYAAESNKTFTPPLQGFDLGTSGDITSLPSANFFAFTYTPTAKDAQTYGASLFGGVTGRNVTIPDQLTHEFVSDFRRDFSVILSKNSAEYRDNLAAGFGIGVSIFPGIFSASADMSFVRQNVFSRAQSTYLATCFVSYVTAIVRVQSVDLLDPDFQQSLDSLPSTVNVNDTKSLKPFYAFFRKYGTHYVKEVKYGGRAMAKVRVEKISDKAQEGTDVDISLGVQSFFTDIGSLSLRGGSNHTYSSDYYRYELLNTMEIHGGDPMTFNASDVAPWVASVKAQPAVVGKTLAEIYYLQANPERRDTLRQALVQYFNMCPSDKSSLTVCGGHGVCIPEESACLCDIGWTQDSNCTKPAPKKCSVDSNGNSCSGHGQCNPDTGMCECAPGWAGKECGCETERTFLNPVSQSGKPLAYCGNPVPNWKWFDKGNSEQCGIPQGDVFCRSTRIGFQRATGVGKQIDADQAATESGSGFCEREKCGWFNLQNCYCLVLESVTCARECV